MTKETKQDVFDDMATRYTSYLENVIYENGNHHSYQSEAERDTDKLRARYAAATLCELPVIPQAAGEIIRDDREAGRDLAFVLYEAVRMASRRSRTEGKGICSWIVNNQDTFALAWLLGQWEVADDEH